ncbi:SDR family oxidoreductase [Streptomyces sp. 71268]|uniref:SDR family NAD(P)-dependent oxidoreductase n=1 Tax=Streptomyces sp. 71268 TaxID=3002640 RepID=UPI0023F6634A|nr:SDR family NAD(P)-dependent oxidoreductase [Streptomyces sp. 71268]WEV28974.1 SDR family oxidoreductase [Streptomyces sp. 71268]
MLTNPDVTIPDDLHLFTEDWQEAPATAASPTPRHRCALVLLSDEREQERLRRALVADQPDLTVVHAARGADYRRLAADRYEVGGDLEAAYRALLRDVAAEHGPVDVIAHLWATEPAGRDLLWRPDPLRALLRVVAEEAARDGRAPRRVVLGGAFADGEERSALEAWWGFERSIGLVVPGTSLTVLGLDEATGDSAEMPSALAAELAAAEPTGALRTGGRRLVQRVRPATLRPGPDALRTGGTYLITGGAGGLGAIFGSWLARTYGARLALVGRRPADDPAVRARLAELTSAGAGATWYGQADVADEAALTTVLRAATDRFGRVDGVLHAAGVEAHGSIADRDAATFARVLEPKIAGTRALERALAGLPQAPDFVCYFSSSAAVLGDFGSCDYAVANRFQVGYARHLAHQNPAGPRRLAVSWPLWRSDGMNLADADAGDFYLRSSGQRYLEPAEGTALFRHLIAQPEAAYLAMVGQRDRIHATLRVTADAAAVDDADADASATTQTQEAARVRLEDDGADLADALRRDLKSVVSQIMMLPVEKLAGDENFRDFGFDSITLVEFAGVLSERLGLDLTPDVFFSYSTLHTLHEFLLTRHRAQLADHYDLAPVARPAAEAVTAPVPPAGPTREPAPAPTLADANPAPDATPAPEAAPVRPGAKLRTRRGDGSRFAPAKPPAEPHAPQAEAVSLAEAAPQPLGQQASQGQQVQQVQQPQRYEPVAEPAHRAAAPRPASHAAPARRPDGPDVTRDAVSVDEQFAIIGMSGRFPAARTVEEFWDLLAEGRSVIGPMPRERREWWADDKRRSVGAIPGIAEFDPLFFEIAPSEAAAMDPRQRLLLEEMWRALEDAGCGREQLAAERVGVFVGAEEGDYRSLAFAEERITSNHNAVMAARLSYFLNLTGPGIAINTACSSSLVALHEACLSLRHGDCDTAIVAGANLLTTPREYDVMDGAGMLSAQGICRAFDKRADGMVPSEAITVVVLKRRPHAERDGHRIYANILASGVNNDGRTNGITAPSGNAQARLLQEVYQRAGISPDSLSHLVSHGTGTRLGDPVEINALAEAFRPHTARTGFCALTSTKPNVGHALAASGLVSLIGLVVGMRKEIIPPSINCEEISDFVNWSESPFYISREAHAWPERAGQPRRAAVSSFGFSGTNAHVVIESHGTARDEVAHLGDQPAAPWHLLVCSAKTEAALSRQLANLADHLAALPADVGPGVMASVSHTLLAGRHHFARRCALVVRDRAEAVAALRRAADGHDGPEVVRGSAPRDFTPSAAETRALRELAAEAAGDRGPGLLTELARSYCQGHEPAAFAGLWGANPPRRMGLPSYAFEHAEYWVSAAPVTTTGAPTAHLHPLVHRNVSDVTCQRFASTFSGPHDAYGLLSDGTAQTGALLELARAAVVLGLGGGARPIALREVAWHAPVTVPDGDDGTTPLELRVDLRDAGEGRVDWAIYAGEGDDAYLVCDGEAAPVATPTGDDHPAALDLPALRALPGRDRVLVELDPAPHETDGAELVLDSARLEACLAAARQRLGWGAEQGTVTTVAEAGFAATAQPLCWALVTPRADGPADACSLTVELATADGTVAVRLSELTLRQERARPRAAATVAQAPGEGRRPQMRGWTVSQCVAWELADAAGQVLAIPAQELDADENLANYGIDSLNIAKFATTLSGRLGLTLTPDLFFSHPTLGRLANFLLTSHAEHMAARYREGSSAPTAPAAPASDLKRRSERFAEAVPARATATGAAEEPIAIVGMSGRFPDARTVDELWSILTEGRSVIGEAPKERASWHSTEELPEGQQPPKFGSVPGIAEFDPLFFEISPREAELMDPRQRLLLQEMWRALEDAGYGERSLAAGNVGVFVGVEEGDYRYLVDDQATVTSNSNAILASRLAYFLNLSGPSMAINTACSSGLVALREACLSLAYGDCDTAIVAGASLMASDHDFVAMDKANMLSPDRTCYAFDQRANGMVPGEAIAVLVLKKQRAAEHDGNLVYATILGSGINYDGRTNGITAPSGEAQTRLLTSLYDRHHISPDTLEYVVSHGTGTRLGDPIETNALAEAFRSRTDRTGFCALTSIKPNMGHSMAASGLVNLITLVTAMRKETIPPSINCEELSDYIDWDNSPFFVNRQPRPWPATPGRPRRGAVSSFGMSGTNAHVILQAYGTEREDAAGHTGRTFPQHHLLLVSAKTEEALQERLTGLADHLAAQPADDAGYLASVSRTLMTGRHHFALRCAVVVQDREDAVRLLREAAAGVKIPNLVRGTVSRDFAPNATIGKLIEGLVRASRTVWGDSERYSDHLTALAEFYSQGYPPHFEGLWESQPRLTSLPGYPFGTEHYWASAAPGSALAVAPQDSRLHPLVHEHTSDGNVIHRFSSKFSGREAFLNDLLIPIENTTR